jgi:cytochrome c553
LWTLLFVPTNMNRGHTGSSETRIGSARICTPIKNKMKKSMLDGLKKLLAFLTLALGLATAAVGQDQHRPPAWAYPQAVADYRPPVDDGRVRHVANSGAGWTLTQLRDLFFAPDWHPEEHLQMPQVVAHGRKPDVYACGFCHRADGAGGPENASLAGLPEGYITQQMADFKSGARRSSLPERLPSKLMTASAKAATEEEVAKAAAYFSSVKPRKLITVIEASEVPKTYIAGWFFTPVNEQEKEPIAGRIIEMPKDVEQFESRDTHSEFIAYVPVGSIAKGEALAITGGDGKTIPCGKCHAPDLRGLGVVPSIRGRSPSYLVRQLYDMQHGARAGTGSGLMTGVVSNLSEEDFVSLAAYAATLKP